MKAFCYWDAKSLPDTCIVIFNLTITLILFTFAAYNIFKHIRYLSGKIVRIYGLIVLWGLCNSVIYSSHHMPILIFDNNLFRICQKIIT